VVRAEAITDPLEPGRFTTCGEPVGELAEVETRSAGLALGPLVAVDPDLARIGEVATDLDEAVTEVGVVDVEIVRADPPIGLVEAERGRPAVALTPRGRETDWNS
jgi:hypothetical protein